MIYVPKLPGSGLSKRAPGFPSCLPWAGPDRPTLAQDSLYQADGPMHSGGHTGESCELTCEKNTAMFSKQFKRKDELSTSAKALSTRGKPAKLEGIPGGNLSCRGSYSGSGHILSFTLSLTPRGY